jgi:hypothetical protein
MQMAFWDTETAYPTWEQLELYRRVDEENDTYYDIWGTWPFGIGLITMTTLVNPTPVAWYQPALEGEPHWPLPLNMVNVFIDKLIIMQQAGYKLFTWNGTGFDYQLLARLTGRYTECRYLCEQSYDLCFQAGCMQGYPVGLGAVAKGFGLAEKELLGASAPLLWVTDEWEKVVEYGKMDAVRTRDVTLAVMKHRGICWITRRGGQSFLPIHKILTVSQCLNLIRKYPEWIDHPFDPEETVKWWAYQPEETNDKPN